MNNFSRFVGDELRVQFFNTSHVSAPWFFNIIDESGCKAGPVRFFGLSADAGFPEILSSFIRTSILGNGTGTSRHLPF
jgi:hypothetical protein